MPATCLFCGIILTRAEAEGTSCPSCKKSFLAPNSSSDSTDLSNARVVVSSATILQWFLAAGSTIAPSVVIAALVASVWLTVSPPTNDEIPEPLRVPVVIALVTAFTAVSTVFGLMIGYIVHAGKNPAFSPSERVKWSFALWFGNVVTIPAYWFLHIRKRPEAASMDIDRAR